MLPIRNTRSCVFVIYVMQETGVYEPNCLVSVDEFAFFIYWKSDGKVCTVCSLFNGTSALFRILLPRTVEIKRDKTC